jgi:hypothetical protein
VKSGKTNPWTAKWQIITHSHPNKQPIYSLEFLGNPWQKLNIEFAGTFMVDNALVV